MKTLTEADIIQTMREMHGERLEEIRRELDVIFKTKGGDKENVLSPELKVRHKKTGLLYTIFSVSPRDCILTTPEGEKFIVDADELENSYQLD